MHEIPEPSPDHDSMNAIYARALLGLSSLSLKSRPFPDLLSNVAELAVRTIPRADGAGVSVVHGNRADTTAATANFVTEVEEIQHRLGEGPRISVAATGRTAFSGSLGGEKLWPRFGPRVGRLGVHSVLSLPLNAGDQTVGTMNLYARSKHAFDDCSVQLGEKFAAPAAVSVLNARTLADAMHLAQQLETALHSRSDIDHAIGIIISRTGCGRAEAFDKLRIMSQRENRKLKDIAREVVEEAARRARARRLRS